MQNEELAAAVDELVAAGVVASFDNLQPLRRSFRTQRVGELGAHELGGVCRAFGRSRTADREWVGRR